MLTGSITELKMGASDWLFSHIKDWLGVWEVTRWLPDFPHAVGRLRQKEWMSNLFLKFQVHHGSRWERERKGFFCYGISTWIFTSHLSEYLHFKIKSHWRWGPAWNTSSLGKTGFSAPVLSCGLCWKVLPVPWEPCAHLWAWLCTDLLPSSHLRHLGEMPLCLELDEEPFPQEAETSAAKFSWKPAVEPYLLCSQSLDCWLLSPAQPPQSAKPH